MECEANFNVKDTAVVKLKLPELYHNAIYLLWCHIKVKIYKGFKVDQCLSLGAYSLLIHNSSIPLYQCFGGGSMFMSY